ncbi:patatin-like phospholipase family protein [Palleronia pelagia]|nr:patatin-like phospholipase family protein [Palleronia pelagia]
MLITMGEARARVADTIRDRAATTGDRTPLTLRVLVLSAGGQYGAYGAGFLTGWSQNARTPRPAFDLVTGVSAGAILSVVAQAGPRFDPLLSPWNGLDEPSVLRRIRGPGLLRAPALSDPAPLERLIRTQLSDDLIAALGARDTDGARTLISAVDLESTRAQVFDLGALAGSNLPIDRKRDCLTETLLASAAVPGLFPPRNIDGRLYYDGGLRDQLFLASVDAARDEVARETGRQVTVEARVVLNGALDLPDGPVRDTLPDYFLRAFRILGDEVLRNSVSRVIDFAAKRPHWRLSGVVGQVDLAACGDSALAFDACVTGALFRQGLADGRAVPIDWLGPAELGALALSPGAGTE